MFPLAKEYASVEKINIPFDFDGIAIKPRGEKPRILLNLQNTTPQRMRFTLAHELGHVIIPWHLGMIIEQDVGRRPTIQQNDSQEAEANRFASELLMPSDWVRKAVDDYDEPQGVVDHIRVNAKVSFQAAIIRTVPFNGVDLGSFSPPFTIATL
jgi:Zn-dependent peptidase ImmA (M78 family)